MGLSAVLEEARAPEQAETAPEPTVVPDIQNDTPAPEVDASDQKTGDDDAKAEASPASEDTDERSSDKTVPLGAMIEERKRRQDAERELDFTRRQHAATQQPQQAQEKPLEFLDDPQKYLDNVLWDNRVAMSQDMMRELHTDYDQVEQSFLEAAQANPSLLAQMRSQGMPAAFAYKAGKMFEETKDVGSIPEWKERERKKIRVELEAENRKKLADDTAATIPPSTVGARGSGQTAAAPSFEPRSLAQLLSAARRG